MPRGKSQTSATMTAEQPEAVVTEPSTPAAAESKQYAPQPNPRAWDTNNDAGTEFRTRTDPYESQIAFKEKPSQEVLDYVKQQGFRFRPEDKAWTKPIGFNTKEQDRLAAKRTYAEVVRMTLKEKGIEASPEVAF